MTKISDRTVREIHHAILSSSNISIAADKLEVGASTLSSHLRKFIYRNDKGKIVLVNYKAMKEWKTESQARQVWGDAYDQPMIVVKEDISIKTVKDIHKAILDSSSEKIAARILKTSASTLSNYLAQFTYTDTQLQIKPFTYELIKSNWPTESAGRQQWGEGYDKLMQSIVSIQSNSDFLNVITDQNENIKNKADHQDVQANAKRVRTDNHYEAYNTNSDDITDVNNPFHLDNILGLSEPIDTVIDAGYLINGGLSESIDGSIIGNSINSLQNEELTNSHNSVLIQPAKISKYPNSFFNDNQSNINLKGCKNDSFYWRNLLFFQFQNGIFICSYGDLNVNTLCNKLRLNQTKYVSTLSRNNNAIKFSKLKNGLLCSYNVGFNFKKIDNSVDFVLQTLNLWLSKYFPEGIPIQANYSFEYTSAVLVDPKLPPLFSNIIQTSPAENYYHSANNNNNNNNNNFAIDNNGPSHQDI